MTDRKKVIVVGGVPSPIGGVTSYISRLVLAFPTLFETLLDLYEHKDKVFLDSSLGVNHEVFNGIRITFLSYLLKKNNYIIHFNFSTLKALIFLFLLPKRSLQKWVLTLHNGNPARNFNNSWSAVIYKKIFKVTLKKFDKIVYLNDKQYELYLILGVDMHKLVDLDSFVPFSEIKQCSKPLLINDLFPKVDFEHSIIMNGYCKEFYNFHHGIEYVLSRKNSVLIIALYGDTDDSYERDLINLIGSSNRVKVMRNLNQAEFNRLLAQCSIYLRANSIDSFGIAVADAVCLGLKVIASDICSRFDGAITYKTGNRKELFKLLDDINSDDINSDDSGFSPFVKEDYLKVLFDKYTELYDFTD
jgi:hypothetical protein